MGIRLTGKEAPADNITLLTHGLTVTCFGGDH